MTHTHVRQFKSSTVHVKVGFGVDEGLRGGRKEREKERKNERNEAGGGMRDEGEERKRERNGASPEATHFASKSEVRLVTPPQADAGTNPSLPGVHPVGGQECFSVRRRV